MVGIRAFASGVLGRGRDRGGRKAVTNYQAMVAEVGGFESAMRARSDGDLRGLRGALKARLGNGTSLDALLPVAFAAVREASRRALGLRQFDEQILGGIALHNGALIEMKTGEGKTLTAIAPAYLNALTGDAVHVLTGDDYLAARDAQWMAPVYRLLGMDCALLGESSTAHERRAAYAAEVTYGVYTEFCYDYLRDNLAGDAGGIVQRGRGFAIVDEADLVMIDSGTSTPRISAPAPRTDRPTDLGALALLATGLLPDQDYTLDRAARRLDLTDAGVARVESLLGVPALYSANGGELLRTVRTALYVKEFWQRDRDYLVEDGRISIIDQRTGRIPTGNAGGGMHAALLAKEGLPGRDGHVPIAMTSVRGYLLGYPKLAAMTGVAVAESELYHDIYRLPVIAVPPHRPIIRVDRPIVVYADDAARMRALIDTVAEHNATGRPVLVGTGSIERSERISSALTAAGLANLLLNAKQHADEARIIAGAGRKGAITVVTRMAGRGVDIRLGGDSAEEHAEVLAAGGLFVLGTELYESRRQELHLRGRAGRQGDPGESVFYLAADEVIRESTGQSLLSKVSISVTSDLAQPLDGKLVQLALERSIDRRTDRVAAHFRRSVAYCAVLDEQYDALCRRRRSIVDGADLGERIRKLIDEVIGRGVATARQHKRSSAELIRALSAYYPVTVDVTAASRPSGVDYPALGRLLAADAQRAYDRRKAEVAAVIGGTPVERDELVRELERRMSYTVIDKVWRGHLRAIENLLEEDNLRGAAGENSLARYQRDAAALFESTQREIDEQIVGFLFHLKVERNPAAE